MLKKVVENVNTLMKKIGCGLSPFSKDLKEKQKIYKESKKKLKSEEVK